MHQRNEKGFVYLKLLAIHWELIKRQEEPKTSFPGWQINNFILLTMMFFI